MFGHVGTFGSVLYTANTCFWRTVVCLTQIFRPAIAKQGLIFILFFALSFGFHCQFIHCCAFFLVVARIRRGFTMQEYLIIPFSKGEKWEVSIVTTIIVVFIIIIVI